MTKKSIGLLLLCLISNFSSAWAQYDLEWIRNFGKAGDDIGKCVLPTTDGGIWLIGIEQKNASTGANAWIIKVNAEGRNLWDVTYGGKKWDEARKAITTPNGGLVVLGVTESKGSGKSDIWLFELNADGDMLWDQTYGEKGWDEGMALMAIREGGFMIAGSSKIKGKKDDLWAIRVDKKGQQLWDLRLGGDEWEGCHDLLELPDGSILLAGHTASNGLGMDDGWLIKTSSRGDVLWEKHFGGINSEAMHSLILNNDSTLLITGFTQSQGINNANLWLVNMDLEGNLRWEKTIGGNKFDKARAMIQTRNGHLLFAGYTHSQGAGNGDAWVVETTIDGEKIWEDTFGGPGFDKAFDLTELADGSIVLIGNISLAGQLNILTVKLRKSPTTPTKQ